MTEKSVQKSKLNEALEKANEAVKEMKKMGVSTKDAISEDFQALKDVFSDSNVAGKLREAKEYSVSKVKDASAIVDQNVKEKPYYYIGGAAVIGLLIGLLISRKS